MNHRGAFVAGLLAGCAMFFARGAEAAAAPEFDHQHHRYAEVLRRSVSGGLVDYRYLHDHPEELDRYLDELAATPERAFELWTLPERLSFLINLYNATVLKMVAGKYPVSSFKRVAGFFGDPWDEPTVRLFGSRITLGILRDNILRRFYAEPAIHFALCSAAAGGPNLRGEPYVPDRLFDQLENQLRQFLSDSRRNRFDSGRNRIYLSPVFRWYEADFAKRSGSVLVYLRPYLPEGFGPDVSIRYEDFDWSLNERPMDAE